MELGFPELTAAFRRAGVEAGDTIFVHAALRTLGRVEGGAPAVARALQAAVGPAGTLCAPAFSFVHEIEENPLIDPQHDPSEMGAVTEAVRLLPGALRSAAYRHSVSAVGPGAAAVTDVDHTLSVFDIRSSFGRLLALDAKIVLLGVTYENCTAHHFAEYILKVPDRETVRHTVRLVLPDGSVQKTVMTDYCPRATENGDYYAYPHDFNRIGVRLEQLGGVRIAPVGNAICRVFRLRELIHLILDSYSLHPDLFAEDPETGKAQLTDGVTVYGGEFLDGANRPDDYIWSVVDPEKLYRLPNSEKKA